MKKHSVDVNAVEKDYGKISIAVNREILRGKKKIVMTFWRNTIVGECTEKQLLFFLKETKLKYTCINESNLIVKYIIKIDGRNTYVKTVKDKYKKGGN